MNKQDWTKGAKALGKLRQGFMTLEDIRRYEEQKPVEERLEKNYRRGYRDGWVQAVLAMGDLMFQGKLTRQAALDTCYEFWNKQLFDWMRGDCSRMVLPPNVER